MLFLFPAFILSETIHSLSLDDTYHEVEIDNKTNVTYWVQPYPKHSAILVIHKDEGIRGYKRKITDADFTAMSSETIERSNGFVESRYTFDIEDPLLFRLGCTSECSVVVNYVHTDPVYRQSAVLGSFALFVCLFLLVFSWAVFCGACRATRKR